MTKNSYLPYTTHTAPRVIIQTENTTSITPFTQTYNILHHSKAKKTTIFNNGCYTTNIPTVTTTDIKTNLCHIHTSIVSGHPATRGNKKYCAHLHHTLAAMKRYFPVSLVTPLPNSEQIYHPSSNHTKHKVDTKSYPSPLSHLPPVTLTHTTHIISSTAPTLSPLELWIDQARVTALLARWTEKLASGPQAGRSRTPLTTRVMGVGRQQQHSTLFMFLLQSLSSICLW